MHIPEDNADGASVFINEAYTTGLELEADVFNKLDTSSTDPNTSFPINTSPV